MSIISTSCKVFSEIANFSRCISPTTGAMLAAATAIASVQIAPASGVFLLGGTVLGAYYNAKKDIKLNIIQNETKNIRNLVPSLDRITDQAKMNTLEFKTIYENLEGFLPKLDGKLDEQEAQLVQQGNILQAIKKHHDEWILVNNNLKSLNEQEIRLVGHINHLEELEGKKQKNFENNIKKQLTHWNNLVEKLKQSKEENKREVVQEICQEIRNLTEAINKANALNKTSVLNPQTTEIVEKDKRSSCQQRTEVAARPAFYSKVDFIPLTRERVSLNRRIG